MSARPTGRHVRRDDVDLLVLERDLDLPVRELWAAVTDSGRLARWFGTWEGDPASGRVRVRMTAEGEDVEAAEWEVRACEPPHRVALHRADAYGVWDVELTVAEAGGGARLTFAQVVHDPAALESIGPGWDWYLDRLVAAETGGDPATLDWDAYYPALAAHYRAVASTLDR